MAAGRLKTVVWVFRRPVWYAGGVVILLSSGFFILGGLNAESDGRFAVKRSGDFV